MPSPSHPGGDPFSHPSGSSVSRPVWVTDQSAVGGLSSAPAPHALLPAGREPENIQCQTGFIQQVMTWGSRRLAAARPTCRRLPAWSNHHKTFPWAVPAAAGLGLGETRRNRRRKSCFSSSPPGCGVDHSPCRRHGISSANKSRGGSPMMWKVCAAFPAALESRRDKM